MVASIILFQNVIFPFFNQKENHFIIVGLDKRNRQNKTFITAHYAGGGCVCSRFSPQTAGGVSQQHGGLELDLVFVAVRDAAPARVGDDDRVGQRGQSVTDDGHLHCVT